MVSSPGPSLSEANDFAARDRRSGGNPAGNALKWINQPDLGRNSSRCLKGNRLEDSTLSPNLPSKRHRRGDIQPFLPMNGVNLCIETVEDSGLGEVRRRRFESVARA